LQGNKKMILRCFCSLSIQALTYAIAAQSLQLTVNQTIGLIESHDVPGSLAVFNQSIPSLNTSFGVIEIECDAIRFGVNPNLDDCMSANRYFSDAETMHTWSSRHSGSTPDDHPLPFRMLGSMLNHCFQSPSC
jgi:hypothetical protein